MVSTYDMSVPIFQHTLTNLLAVLKKGEQWCKDNDKPESTLTEGKIIDDMLPLTFQVQSCCNTSKNTPMRVAGLELPSMEDKEKTFAELYTRIEKTIEMLKGIDKAAFEGKETTDVEFKTSKATLHFKGLDYIQTFALPNFFFHAGTAYNILRKAGVDVGKMDYLGKIGGA